MDKIFQGIDFLTSKGGGYPLDSFTRISKIFQTFQARGELHCEHATVTGVVIELSTSLYLINCGSNDQIFGG